MSKINRWVKNNIEMIIYTLLIVLCTSLAFLSYISIKNQPHNPVGLYAPFANNLDYDEYFSFSSDGHYIIYNQEEILSEGSYFKPANGNKATDIEDVYQLEDNGKSKASKDASNNSPAYLCFSKDKIYILGFKGTAYSVIKISSTYTSPPFIHY